MVVSVSLLSSSTTFLVGQERLSLEFLIACDFLAMIAEKAAWRAGRTGTQMNRQRLDN
jgi:hypothetical protein